MKHFSLLTLLFITFLGFSQKTSSSLRLQGAYFSESFVYNTWMNENGYIFFNNNGGNLGLEHSFLKWQPKKSFLGSSYTEGIVGIETYIYPQSFHSVNGILSLEAGGRQNFDFGLFITAKWGIGYFHSTLYRDIYTVDQDGNVTEESGNLSAGNLIFPYSFGIGWHFKKIPVEIQVRTLHFCREYGSDMPNNEVDPIFLSYMYKRSLILGIQYEFKKVKLPFINLFKSYEE
jgi:hypothetical protein